MGIKEQKELEKLLRQDNMCSDFELFHSNETSITYLIHHNNATYYLEIYKTGNNYCISISLHTINIFGKAYSIMEMFPHIDPEYYELETLLSVVYCVNNFIYECIDTHPHFRCFRRVIGYYNDIKVSMNDDEFNILKLLIKNENHK